MKKNIEKKEAEKNWRNPLKRIALQKIFGTFEEYWKECERFNYLNQDQKYDYVQQATKTIKTIKKEATMRRLNMLKS